MIKDNFSKSIMILCIGWSDMQLVLCEEMYLDLLEEQLLLCLSEHPLVILIDTFIFLNYMYTYTYIFLLSQYFLSIDYTIAYSVHFVVECISRTLLSCMAETAATEQQFSLFFPHP